VRNIKREKLKNFLGKLTKDDLRKLIPNMTEVEFKRARNGHTQNTLPSEDLSKLNI
jgi:hypothetical protein